MDLRDQVHKWREERQQRMVQRLMKNNKNEVKPLMSSAVLGIKSSSSCIPASSQNNKEKNMLRKPPIEVRQTKTSVQRHLLANPLLEPRNVEFLDKINKRRETLCSGKSETNELHVPKIIDKETHREQVLKMMGKYDLNGRRVTMHGSNEFLNKTCTTESQTETIPKCKIPKRENCTNNMRNSLSNKHELSKIECNNSKGRNRLAIQNLEQGRLSQSLTNTVNMNCTQLYNKELVEFEQNYCKSDFGESVYQDKPNNLLQKKRETLSLCKGKLPSLTAVNDTRRMTFTKTNTNYHKVSVPKSVPRQSNCRLTMTMDKKLPIVHTSTGPMLGKKSYLRRSQSQEYLARKNTISIGRRSSSTEELTTLRKQVKIVSPIIEETSPEANLTISGPSCETPKSKELRTKLSNWLSQKGIPLNNYRHLQRSVSPERRTKTKVCSKVNESLSRIQEEEAVDFTFNLCDEVDEANKENICTGSIEDNREELDETQVMNVIREALIDLRNLVLAGYDHDECEAWVETLCRRCGKIKDFVEYWECLASLDEARGDYDMALDSYQRAIVRGAEVEDINKQFDDLLDKMNHLHLDTPLKEKKGLSPRNNLDMNNIFKSRMIQFALQQKAVKNLNNDLGKNTQALYVATPVRRSTRRNIYDPKCVRSLDDLEPEKRCLTDFQPNSGFQ